MADTTERPPKTGSARAASNNGHKKGGGDFHAFEVSFDEGAEIATLCSIGIDPSTYDEVAKIVQPRDFYREKHQLIFRAMGDIRGRGDPPDFLTLVDELETQGRLEAVGGIAEVAQIFNDSFVPDAGNVTAYARIVLKHAIRRKHLQVAEIHGAMSQDDNPKWIRALELADKLVADMHRRMAGTSEDDERGAIKLCSVQEILAMPDQEELVAGFFWLDTTSMVSGAPGAGKSIILLDMAAHVAWERERPDWHGNAVRGGHVVYIAAEGVGGLKKRLQAWLINHELDDLPRLRIVKVPVQLLNAAQLATLLAKIRQDLPENPVWIIIDTLRQTAAGTDENSNSDMSGYTRAMNAIRQETGACVTVIHHNTKDDATYAGALALAGNVDTTAVVTLSGQTSTLQVTKQRDEEKRAFSFTLRKILLDEFGRRSSVVVEAAPTAPMKLQRALQLPEKQQQALLALYHHPDRMAGLSSTSWFGASHMSESTFHSVRAKLVEGGYVQAGGVGYIPTTLGLRVARAIETGNDIA